MRVWDKKEIKKSFKQLLFYRGLTFQEIFNRFNNWINEGSGWIIELTDGKFVYVFIYSPLLGISYMELPEGLRNSKKVLINIKTKITSVFLDGIL